MTDIPNFSEFASQLREFIQRCSVGADARGESEFNQFAVTLFRLQFAHNRAYRQICERRKVAPETISAWRDIPAIPAVAFKELQLTSLTWEQQARVFHSSGTTINAPSRHFHSIESLELYEASLLAWFWPHFPNARSTHFLFLTPQLKAVPHSSLVYMFETLCREFGSDHALFTGEAQPDGAWSIDVNETISLLRDAIAAKQPVTLLGTAFNFVHLLDELEKEDLRFELPAGSCVLETGGYKGRSRVVAKTELHAQISKRFGVPDDCIVSEYGMSELSSQGYDSKAGPNPLSPQRGPRCAERTTDLGKLTGGGLGKPLGRGEGWEHSTVKSGTCVRVFRFPPWARAQIVNPENDREVADGETGLIRIFDLANVYSVMAVQTEDLGVRRGDGFELVGRAALSETRGCSLMSI